jgi:hypothetical protein
MYKKNGFFIENDFAREYLGPSISKLGDAGECLRERKCSKSTSGSKGLRGGGVVIF